MESKILHIILDIIDNFKTKGASYFQLKNRTKKLNINLNEYLTFLVRIKNIKKKKKRFYFLKNTINSKMNNLIELDSDDEIEENCPDNNNKKNIASVFEKTNKVDNNNETSESSDEYSDIDDIPYFVFGDDDDNVDLMFEDNNLNNLSFLLNMLNSNLDFDNISEDVSEDIIDDKKKEKKDVINVKESSNDEKKEVNNNKSLLVRFNLKLNDIYFLEDSLKNDKIDIEEDKLYELELNLPYELLNKLLDIINKK